MALGDEVFLYILQHEATTGFGSQVFQEKEVEELQVVLLLLLLLEAVPPVLMEAEVRSFEERNSYQDNL